MIRVSWRAVVACLGLAAGMVGAASASAAPIISIDIQAIGGEYDQYTLEQEGAPGAGGTFILADNGYGTNFNCDWSVIFNPDPSITSTFSLTNLNLTSTQTFVMTVSVPIAVFGPATVRGGYFGFADPLLGTKYIDSNGDGDVSLGTVSGSAFYTAMSNGGVVNQILGSFGPPFPLNANGPAGISGVLSQQSWGTPIPSAAFGEANTNMQIQWMFTLTPGDTVQTRGFFQIENAPEPATFALIGLGLAAMVGLRARRA